MTYTASRKKPTNLGTEISLVQKILTHAVYLIKLAKNAISELIHLKQNESINNNSIINGENWIVVVDIPYCEIIRKNIKGLSKKVSLLQGKRVWGNVKGNEG